jgi:hypothetical protein
MYRKYFALTLGKKINLRNLKNITYPISAGGIIKDVNSRYGLLIRFQNRRYNWIAIFKNLACVKSNNVFLGRLSS